MKYFSSIIIAFIGSLFLMNCATNPISFKTEERGDLDVTAKTLGALVFESIGEVRSAEDLFDIQDAIPAADLLRQSAMPEISSDARQQGLGKKSAANGFEIDTIEDIIRLTVITPLLLGTRYDTVEVLMDAAVFDGIEGNETIVSFRGATVRSNGKTEYYAVKDGDGDNVINGTSVSQKAVLTFKTVYSKNVLEHPAGETEIISIEAGAGDDNIFGDENDSVAQADNLIYKASSIKMRNGDTIAYVLLEDADGDGVVASGGKGKIDIRIFEKNNPLKPLTEYCRASVCVERDGEGKERTVRFVCEEKLITGRLNRVWVVDSSGDSTISSGEIALVHIATNSPATNDSEVSAMAILTIDPGENIGDESDNIIREIYLAKSFRLGRIDSLEFHCTFDPPVPHGQEPTEGSFELKAFIRNGTTATLVGTFDAGVIEATFTGPQGDVVDVTLNEGDSES